MFGDNESVVNSSKNFYSKLTKRHNALSYHRVREAIASRYVRFTYIPGKNNPADILSKYWSYRNVKDLLLTFLLLNLLHHLLSQVKSLILSFTASKIYLWHHITVLKSKYLRYGKLV